MAKLVCNVGGMFSGKSTELQRQGRRHVLAGHRVVFLKPEYDNRYSNDCVVTHLGDKVEAINVLETILIPEVLEADVILIDEIQFFPAMVVVEIKKLLRCNKTIYVSGLDMDSNGNGYITVEGLMTIADQVQKFKAVCEECGQDATFTDKRIKNDLVNELGSKDIYIPLCRNCYYKANPEGGDANV